MSSINNDRFLLPAWGISLVLHSIAVALAVTFAAQVKPILKEEVFQWEVVLVQAVNQEPAQERSEPGVKPSQHMARMAPAPPREPVHQTSPREMAPVETSIETPNAVQRESPLVLEPVKPIEPKVEPPLLAKVESVERKVEVAKPTVAPIEEKVEVLHQQKIEPVAHAAVEVKEPKPVMNAEPIVAQSRPVAPASPAESVEARHPHHEPAAGAPSHEVPTVHAMSAHTSQRESCHAAADEASAGPPAADPAPVTAPSPSPAATEAPVQVAKATAPGSEVKADHRWLAESLWRRVAELKRYPAAARLNGLEGKVVLKAVIRSDGHLVEVSVQKSSGHNVLDAAAMEVVRLATPLTMTHPLMRPEIVVSLPIVYSLSN